MSQAAIDLNQVPAVPEDSTRGQRLPSHDSCFLLRVPAVTEESTRTIRSLSLPSCVSHWLTSLIGIFCIGLVSGFGGGCLLGKTAVVSLKSLELLADDELLMFTLEFWMVDISNQENIKLTGDDQMTYFLPSSLIDVFGVCSSAWSLTVGVFIGLSTYDFMIRKYGETAKAKALFLAGPVCLMGVTATGYLLGLGLKIFLSCDITVLLPSAFVILEIYINVNGWERCGIYGKMINNVLFIPLVSSQFAFFILRLIYVLFSKTMLTFIIFLFPANWILSDLNCDFHDTVWSLPLILIMTDVFNIVKQPIITLDSPKMAHVAVLEGLFVGVLTYQCFVMVVGMSLFESWRTGGAAKICFSAAALGGAVLTVVESVLHVLGPGPTIGALTGIAGTAGVSLAAGMATTDQGSFLGRLGVAVGAAVGAFLSSCTHSGLSGLFMSLWAAMIAAGLCVQMLVLFLFEHDTRWSFFLSVFIIVVTIICFSVWFYFTCTTVAAGLFSILFFVALVLFCCSRS